MGCLYTKISSFRRHMKTFKQLYEVNKEDFQALRISFDDAKKLFGVFIEMDGVSTGFLHVNTILRYCGIEETPFAKRALAAWDMKTNGKLSFHAFVMTLWSICSLSANIMGDFVFDIYDNDGSKDLDKSEVSLLIRDLFGRNFEANIEAVRLNREIEKLKATKSIDIEAFYYLVKMTDSLLNPAFDMQYKLIHIVLGAEFWMKHKKRRAETYGSRRYLRVNEVIKAYKLRTKRFVPLHLQMHREEVNNGAAFALPTHAPPTGNVGIKTVAPAPEIDFIEQEELDATAKPRPIHSYKIDWSESVADLQARGVQAKIEKQLKAGVSVELLGKGQFAVIPHRSNKLPPLKGKKRKKRNKKPSY